MPLLLKCPLKLKLILNDCQWRKMFLGPDGVFTAFISNLSNKPNLDPDPYINKLC